MRRTAAVYGVTSRPPDGVDDDDGAACAPVGAVDEGGAAPSDRPSEGDEQAPNEQAQSNSRTERMPPGAPGRDPMAPRIASRRGGTRPVID